MQCEILDNSVSNSGLQMHLKMSGGLQGWLVSPGEAAAAAARLLLGLARVKGT